MKEALKKRGKKQGECVDKSWERGLYSVTKQACNSSSGLSGHAHTHRQTDTHRQTQTHIHTVYLPLDTQTLCWCEGLWDCLWEPSMRQDRHYQGIRGEIMLVSSPTDNNSYSQSSTGQGSPRHSCLQKHSAINMEKKCVTKVFAS